MGMLMDDEISHALDNAKANNEDSDKISFCF